MKRALLGGLLLIAGAMVQAENSVQTTVSNIQTLPFSLTSAAPSQTLVLDVSSSDQLMVDIESGDTPIDIQVTDPSGAPLDAALIERYSIIVGEEPPLGAVFFSAGEHVVFTIDNPMPGQWTVDLTLLAGSLDVLGSLTRITTGGLGVELLTTRPSYRENQEVVLSALVFDGATPVAGTTVSAEVFTEDGVLAPEFPAIVLYDDGHAPDSLAGDGVYTTSLSGLAPGHYLAQAQITAGADSAVGSTRFNVTSTLATFTIDTLTASRYIWSGDVRSPEGQVLGVANSSGNLAAGPNSVSLVFDGHDIGSSGVNGPYLIGHVAAYGNNGGATVVDVLGETSPYFASQFEGGTPTFDFLIKEVTELVITGVGGVPRADGIRTSLLQKLENAKRLYLENDRVNAASNLVDAFAKEVAAQSGVHILSTDADRLILLAQQLAASL